MEIMAIEVPVKESIEVPQGNHKGEIADVKQETRGDKGYTYIDIHVTVDDIKKQDGSPLTIKAGFPATVSQKSGLGKTLVAFGCPKEKIDESAGSSLDIEEFLKKGTAVVYMTKDVEAEGGGKFAEIVDGTLKPA